MAQVSKRHLSKEVEERMLDLFWTSLSMLSTKNDVSSFLDDLLTPTEKIMISKRLAVAFMLLKGQNYPIINDKLKVSDQTIWGIKMNLEHKDAGYKPVIDKIMKKERWKNLWQGLSHELDQLIPPRPGTNWKEVRRKQWRKRRKQQKPF